LAGPVVGVMMRAMLRWFRGVAVVEAISYLVLLAASVAKHVFGNGSLVDVLGPLHGTIFLVYLALALNVRERLRWPWSTMGVVTVAAAIPFGAIVVERRLLPHDDSDDSDDSDHPAIAGMSAEVAQPQAVGDHEHG
jgi:integral membrane protein